ncbi:MAG: hypothetical protein H0W74_10935 [Sphingosinicella sp.]|nr:hypothetical protein [Sphingosinicella sp.]
MPSLTREFPSVKRKTITFLFKAKQMELTLKQIEDILSTRYGIEPARAGAFRGRLQHLQRGSFPDGVNTGKGHKAIYGWDQLIQLSVALDLIDLGLSPEPAKAVVRMHLEKIRAGAASIGVLMTSATLLKAVREETLPFSKSVFLVTAAQALSNLAGSEASPGPRLNVMAGPNVIEIIRDESPYAVAESVINIGKRLISAMKMISMYHQIDEAAVVADFEQWANANVLGS